MHSLFTSRHTLSAFSAFMLSLIALAATPSDVLAGPWTKKRGEYYVKVSELYFSSNTFVAPNGERVAGTDYLALTTALYAELGLTKRVHLQGFLPWAFTRNAFEEQGTRYATVGLGDALLAIQATPFDLPLPWALRLEAKLPLYDVQGTGGGDALNFPALGDGQIDLTTWLSLGGSLWPTPVYFLGEVGYRRRTGVFYGEGIDLDFKDGVAFRAQAGYVHGERFLIAGNLNGIYTPVDDTFTQSFVTAGPALGLRLGASNFWLEATVDPMLWSKNNAPGTTWSVGLSHRQP